MRLGNEKKRQHPLLPLSGLKEAKLFGNSSETRLESLLAVSEHLQAPEVASMLRSRLVRLKNPTPLPFFLTLSTWRAFPQIFAAPLHLLGRLLHLVQHQIDFRRLTLSP